MSKTTQCALAGHSLHHEGGVSWVAVTLVFKVSSSLVIYEDPISIQTPDQYRFRCQPVPTCNAVFALYRSA